MDPLSSLRFAVTPQLRVARLPQDQATRAGGLEGPELSKLSGASDPGATGAVAESSSSFENTLGSFVKDVSAQKTAADQAVTGMLSGQNVPLHQAMISMEEANVSFQLMVEVRNKLLESYQELMRMQI